MLESKRCLIFPDADGSGRFVSSPLRSLTELKMGDEVKRPFKSINIIYCLSNFI
jgi:hypothetical protein